jgi:hypothetical protein
VNKRTDDVAEFRINVQASPCTNDHEVCLWAGDVNLVEFFAPDLMGLDPGEILIEPCTLRVGPELRQVIIGRCR